MYSVPRLASKTTLEASETHQKARPPGLRPRGVSPPFPLGFGFGWNVNGELFYDSETVGTLCAGASYVVSETSEGSARE